MATINPVITPIPGDQGLDGYLVQWGPMTFTDTVVGVGPSFNVGGTVFSTGGGFIAGYADKTIQVEGTFGAGGSVVLEGTNDGNPNHYRPLTNPQGTPIALTAAGLQALTEAVIWVRARVTAGDGTTALTASVFFRRTQI